VTRGQLSVLMTSLFEHIAHGDESHRQWLKNKLEEFAATVELPRRRDFLTDVEEFHEKFGVGYEGKPRALPTDLGEFRRKFLLEEGSEYGLASGAAEYCVQQKAIDGTPHTECLVGNLADSLDALVDSVYVALGNAVMHGFNFREAWRRVHWANMQKARAPSAEASKRGHAMDVVKPPGWEAPDHTDLVEEHAHR